MAAGLEVDSGLDADSGLEVDSEEGAASAASEVFRVKLCSVKIGKNCKLTNDKSNPSEALGAEILGLERYCSNCLQICLGQIKPEVRASAR